MNENIQLYYDTDEDILEITLGEPSPCIFDEVEDDVFEAHDKSTNEIRGYKIFNFLKHGMKNIKMRLPANLSFQV